MRTRTRFCVHAVATLAVSGALFGMAVGAARAQLHDEDLILDWNGSQIVLLDADALERLLEFDGVSYFNDTGFDVAPGLDAGNDYLGRTIRQVTIQQESISDGISAFYLGPGSATIFGKDATLPKAWTLAESKPPAPAEAVDVNGFFFHQHFGFVTDTPGDYQFTYSLRDLVLTDGTEISGEVGRFTINYTTTAVPEPGALAGMAALGAVSGLWAMRRRNLRATR